jgi:hypothetical protein
VELEEQNPLEEPVHQQDQVSTTDPDSTYATKGGTPARLGYYDNYLVDNHSCVIVGVQGTAARMSQETVAAQDMLARFAQWQGRAPESVAADTTYGNGSFCNGWPSEKSLRTCGRGRVLSARTAPSMDRSVSPISRKATVSLSGGRTTQLRWLECSQSCSRLHWQRQTLRDLLAKTTMHEWTIQISCDPHG